MGDARLLQSRVSRATRGSYRSTGREAWSVVVVLGLLVLLRSVKGRAAFNFPPAGPLDEPGSPEEDRPGEDGSENYIGRESADQAETATFVSEEATIGEDGGERYFIEESAGQGKSTSPASEDTRLALQLSQERQALPLRQRQQQQQPAQGGGGQAGLPLPPLMKVLSFLSLPQQHVEEGSNGPARLLAPFILPHVQLDSTEKPSTGDLEAEPAGKFPLRLPEIKSPTGPGIPASPAAGIWDTLQGTHLSAVLSQGPSKATAAWLAPYRQLTPEEEEEEALADALIHGAGRKRVPRVHTAVDALIDAIEDQKLQLIATSQRHLEYLRKRREADITARESARKVPDYFSNLAKEAAAYHRKKKESIQKRKTEYPSGLLEQQLHTLAHRQQQKDKLLHWRENQIYQSLEEGPELEKQLAEAHRTGKDLEAVLLQELSKEDLFWVAGENGAQQEESTKSNVETLEGDEK